MPFTEHLEELRSRLLRAVAALGVGFLVCLPFKEELFQLLMQPLRAALCGDVPLHECERSMVQLGAADIFFTYLKVALLGGLMLASPYVFLQLWRFVAPGLYDREKRYVVPFALASAGFFVMGALFGYFVVMPIAFEFFLGFENAAITSQLDVKRNFDFAIRFLVVFGLVFEEPVLIFLLSWAGLVNAAGLRSAFRYVVVGAFVASAVLTPPDPITQTALAVPLIVLYGLGIGVAHLIDRRRAARPAGAAPDPASTAA